MHITLQQNNHTHLSFLLQLNWSTTYQGNTHSLQISLFSVHVYISLFIVHIYAITLYRTHEQQTPKTTAYVHHHVSTWNIRRHIIAN